VTPQQFRKLALSLPEAREGSHMGTADFRVRNKIFATLSGPDQLVIRIDPADQAVLLATEPGTFSPAAGVWGLRGWTIVQLGTVDPDLLHDLVVDSWRRLAPKKMVAAYDDDAQT
jgi:hypothetical protein